MNYATSLLTCVLALVTFASCTKDLFSPSKLESQELSIDMSQYGDAALLAVNEDGAFEVLSLQEGRNRAADVRFVLVHQQDAAGTNGWVLASPDDKALDGLFADFPVRPSVSFRAMSADQYAEANPRTQADLNDLFARAKAVTPDGKRTGILEPDTVILAKKDGEDTTWVVYVKICVEGSDWKVCIEISF